MNKGTATPRQEVEYIQIDYSTILQDIELIHEFLDSTSTNISGFNPEKPTEFKLQFLDFEGDWMEANDGEYIIKDATAYFHLCLETEFISDYNIID